MIFQLEICCGSYHSSVVAMESGANRVELCSGLGEGGLTPSVGLIKAVCALPRIAHHVLIRPRGGDFLYSLCEKRIMLDDIETAVSAGAEGVVVGALTAEGLIDVPFLRDCVKAAAGRHVTFHRAFDLCAQPMMALEEIAEAGCDRLLTSGQASTAEKGIDLLKCMVEAAPSTLSIMPGCGVNASNAFRILKATGAREIHASARALLKSQMKYRHSGVNMGKRGEDEYATMETSADEVLRIIKSCRQEGLENG